MKNDEKTTYDVDKGTGAYMNDYLNFSKTMSFENLVIANDKKQSLSRQIISRSFDTCKVGVLKVEH